jgi:hypothetical protein
MVIRKIFIILSLKFLKIVEIANVEKWKLEKCHFLNLGNAKLEKYQNRKIAKSEKMVKWKLPNGWNEITKMEITRMEGCECMAKWEPNLKISKKEFCKNGEFVKNVVSFHFICKFR